MSGTFVPLTRRQVAARAARDIPDGGYVNLGIGLPTLVADALPADREIVLHSENGLLGMGPAPTGEPDPELINAGKDPVTLLPGGSFFNHADAFVMIRGHHLDLAVLGAFEVSAYGDLANFSVGETGMPPAVGGAMDLAVGARRIVVVTTHTSASGTPKLVSRCTLPLTAPRVVSRVYTDLAVLDVADGAFTVRELVPGLTFDELAARTGAPLHVADAVGELVM